MNSWSVDTDANNMRIDRFISERMSDTSRSYIQKLIKDELVTVDSKVVKSNYKVKERTPGIRGIDETGFM